MCNSPFSSLTRCDTRPSLNLSQQQLISAGATLPYTLTTEPLLAPDSAFIKLAVSTDYTSWAPGNGDGSEEQAYQASCHNTLRPGR